MAIGNGATICFGWAATQPCRRRLAVDRRRRLPQLPYLSTISSPQVQVTCAPHKNGALQAVVTEAVGEDDEVLLESPAHFRIYKSCRMDRLNEPTVTPAGLDVATGVTSRDVVLDADTGVSVRLYLPKLPDDNSTVELPVLVYFHGGAFLIGSADDAAYHTYVNGIAAAAGVLVVSVDYRLAPEHPLPAAYDDCWAALRWAVAPSTQDEWISRHGDTARLFLAGDSAGANIVHEMLVRAAASSDGDGGPKMEGAILLHPWFTGSEAIEGELPAVPAFNGMLWSYTCPGAVSGADDPRINPLAPGAPSLERLPCERILVCAAEKDVLATRIRAYHATVAAGACRAAWFESEGEDHDFFLGKPDCESAGQLLDRIVEFIAVG